MSGFKLKRHKWVAGDYNLTEPPVVNVFDRLSAGTRYRFSMVQRWPTLRVLFHDRRQRKFLLNMEDVERLEKSALQEFSGGLYLGQFEDCKPWLPPVITKGVEKVIEAQPFVGIFIGIPHGQTAEHLLMVHSSGIPGMGTRFV